MDTPRSSRSIDRSVHVIGGGLAGLTAAALVGRAGHPVVVHEQRQRLGGRATTYERDGYRFNQGPHALYVAGEGSAILKQLGVDPAGVAPGTRGARMVIDGRSRRLPVDVATLGLTRALGVRDKVDVGRLLGRIGAVDAASVAPTSVAGWIDAVTHRPRAAALLQALVRLGTYVNDPATLSAEVAVLQLQRSLAGGVRYLHGGWEASIVDRLTDIVHRTGGRIERGTVVVDLPDAPVVIVAAGGPQAAARLTGAAFDVGPAAETTVLDLALSTPPTHRFVLGVDEPMYLSDHGSVDDMTPAGRASVSLAHYLAPGDRPDRERLRAFAVRGGVTDDSVVAERYLHRMTTVSAIATASGGGLAGRPPVAVAGQPGVFVAGDWVGRRGHLADAVLASAAEAARQAVAHLERRIVA